MESNPAVDRVAKFVVNGGPRGDEFESGCASTFGVAGEAKSIDLSTSCEIAIAALDDCDRTGFASVGALPEGGDNRIALAGSGGTKSPGAFALAIGV